MNYNVKAILSATDRGFTSTMRKASGVLKGVQNSTNKTGGVMNKVFGSAGSFVKANVIMGAFNKTIGALTSSIGGAVNRLDTMRNFPKMMQQFGYTGEEANASIKKLSKGIEGLPTSLDSVVATTQRMAVATGDLDKSTDLVIALNNAFLSSGSSSADAERGLTQYLQMVSTGTADLESWKTLQETMPVGLQKTAEAFGFAGASAQRDLYKALQNGEITFDQFGDKLIELNDGVNGFSEMAKTNSNGIATSFTNIKTAITRNMAEVINAIDEGLQNNGLGSIAENLDKFKNKINEVFNLVIPHISTFIGYLANANTVIGPLIPSLLAFTGAFGFMAKGLPVLNLMTGGLSHLTGVITTKMPQAFSFLSGFMGQFISLGPTMSKSLGVVTNLSGTFLGHIATMVKTGLMLISPIAILGVVLAGMGLIYSQFHDQIDNVINIVVTKAPSIINGITSTITSKLPELINAGTQLVSHLISGITRLLPTIINAGLNIVESLVSGVGNNMPQLIKTGITLIGSLVSNLLDALPRLIMVGMNLLKSLANGISQNIPYIITVIRHLVLKLINKVVTYFPQIIQKGVEIVTSLANGIARNLPKILSMGIELIGKLIAGIIRMVPQAVGGIGKVILGITNALRKVNLLDLGKNIIRGLIRGIGSMAGAVIESIGGVVKGAISGAKKLLGIKSPSRIFKAIGAFTSEGFAIGIVDKLSAVKKATQDMHDTAIDPLQQGLNAMSNVGHINTNYSSEFTANQPAYINLSLGGNRFKAFVEDISKVQADSVNLELGYGM